MLSYVNIALRLCLLWRGRFWQTFRATRVFLNKCCTIACHTTDSSMLEHTPKEISRDEVSESMTPFWPKIVKSWTFEITLSVWFCILLDSLLILLLQWGEWIAHENGSAGEQCEFSRWHPRDGISRQYSVPCDSFPFCIRDVQLCGGRSLFLTINNEVAGVGIKTADTVSVRLGSDRADASGCDLFPIFGIQVQNDPITDAVLLGDTRGGEP